MTPTPEILRFACPADITRVELTLPGRTAHALDLGLCGTIDEELSLINPAKKMLMVRADLAVSREASMVG